METLTAASAEVESIRLIAEFEGFRSDWYSCVAGTRTIGYGFTKSVLTPDEMKLPSMSRATADKILGREVRKIQRDLKRLFPGRSFTAKQEAALVSFIWNFGLSKFQNSGLYQAVRTGKSGAAVQAEFNKWIHYTKKDGTKAVSGQLVSRRAKEARYWIG